MVALGNFLLTFHRSCGKGPRIDRITGAPTSYSSNGDMEKMPDMEREKTPEEKHLTWFQHARLVVESAGVMLLNAAVTQEVLSSLYGERLSPGVLTAVSAFSAMMYTGARYRSMLGKKEEES